MTKRILITGATGGVGLVLAEALQDTYEVIQHGRTPRTAQQEKELYQADIGTLDDLTELLDGVDTVIHLAGASSPDSEWDDVLEANIVGYRNILEAARQKGVRRVVYASSNHALGMYDRHEQWPVYPDAALRPDSLYGVSKAFGEILGRFYHDEHGLDVINLRIGWMSDDPTTVEEDVLRAMWLSEEDTVRVVRCAIEAEVRFGNYYAISDNPNRRWDLTNTMLELGYRPENSWTDFPAEDETVVEGGAEVRDNWPQGS